MNELKLLALVDATFETCYMVFLSGMLGGTLGLALGLNLYLTKHEKGYVSKSIYFSLEFLTNITRAIPFIILMIILLPVTRYFVGTTIGINATILPLVLAAIPFYARISEVAFNEIPIGIIEMSKSLGVNKWQFIFKVLIPESLPSLVKGMTLTLISLIGYSAMAGAIGGGGLGELAIRYGYQRFDLVIMCETVFVLVVLVQLIQFLGDRLSLKKTKLVFKIYVASLIVIIMFAINGFVSYAEKTGLKLGYMSGPQEQIMQVVVEVAKNEYGLDITLIAFDDYVQPNIALDNGSIDANVFQHEQYLQNQIDAQDLKISSLAKTFVYPLGIYSYKMKDISYLPKNTIIVLPNDPSNESRSLQLLEKNGIISLRQNKSGLYSVQDVLSNRNKLIFKSIDAAQIPRILKDVSLAAITNDFVQATGLNITDAIMKEDSTSNYANIIAVRTSDLDDSNMQVLIQVMRHHKVLQAVYQLYPNGGAIPAWEIKAN